MRIRVYLRPKTVMTLFARLDVPHGGQSWLAERIGVSPAFVSMLLRGVTPVPSGKQGVIMSTFRGMSHKRGGRLSWDDLFQSVLVNSGGAEGVD